MTIWIVLLLIASFVLGVSYVLLGLRASAHLNEQASSSDRAIGWLFWWSFDKGQYDEEGKRLCARGQPLAFVLIGIIVVWNLVLVKKW
jgi:hypothetical protein